MGEEEQTNKDDEDPEPSSKWTKSEKAKSQATKGKRRRKILMKAEKKRFVDHVKSLNVMAVAVLSLTETILAIPNREAELKSACERILPSQVSFYVEHLQEMFEKLYNECSLMKD